jgi:hypothetical protein
MHHAATTALARRRVAELHREARVNRPLAGGYGRPGTSTRGTDL